MKTPLLPYDQQKPTLEKGTKKEESLSKEGEVKTRAGTKEGLLRQVCNKIEFEATPVSAAEVVQGL